MTSETRPIVVEISNTQDRFGLDPRWVEGIVRRTLERQGVGRAAISIVVTDDASIRVINARHLGHDWATDVITFPFSDEDDEILAGELVVSAEMAVKTAGETGGTPDQELALYLVHGLLHLCGYNDQAADDVAVMRAREAAVLRALDVDNPFDRVDRTFVNADDSSRESASWPR